jgi:hypothetical protein
MSYKEVDDYDFWEEMVEEWETVQPAQPYEQSRWQTYYTKVVKSPEGKFYELNWSAGSTEQQDMPWEDEHHAYMEVRPVEKTIIAYVSV